MFIQRTKDQILQTIISNLETYSINKFVITKGTVIREFAEVIANELERIGNIASTEILMKTLDTATGNELDLFGVLFGIDRISESSAYDTTYANVKLYIDPSFNYTAQNLVALIPSDVTSDNIDKINGTFIIKAGLVISTVNTSVTYTTTQDVTFNSTDTYVFVPVTCNINGDTGNLTTGEMLAHNLDTAQPELSTIAPYLLITNTQPIDNGQSEESDYDYRIRLINALSSMASSNEIALRMAAFTVPGIRNVDIIKYIDGLGTTGIKITTVDPIANIGTLRAVENACKKVMAVGETIRIIQPEYTAFKCTIDLVPYSGPITTATKDIIKNNIVDYVINLPEGGEIILSKLISLVGVGNDNVKDANITKMEIGDLDIISGNTLNLYHIAPGNISAGIYEKWYTDYSFIEVNSL